jgi:hypothetical protein
MPCRASGRPVAGSTADITERFTLPHVLLVAELFSAVEAKYWDENYDLLELKKDLDANPEMRLQGFKMMGEVR